MANYNAKPPKEHQFKPGNKLGGRPKGLIRSDDVQALMGKMWHFTREELQKVVQNPKSSMGEIMVASVMAKAAKDGDYSRLSFLLDRTIGRVTDKLELNAKPTLTITRPDGTTVELGMGEKPKLLEEGE